ncbi:PTS sugar transporter subunit IIB [Schnuerera sp. xch1]|uniref:PTS sugar transporter subunit IIB n=1 Tax=Schnuerera sp. xch1 TaxID=2874283 RepID=UPI001CBD6BDA|nr:PTS sugar transporter subunit IIB [Schnuerera sp. xch1]MBZ2174000.1 PTS sugar transporter subunit IIB [Schnuerera sp. xch1]
MKFLAICGFGVGSSMILKMTLLKVTKSLDLDVEVETADLSSAKGMKCDAVFTSKELAKDLKDSFTCPIYEIDKYMNKEEVKTAVEDFLNR